MARTVTLGQVVLTKLQAYKWEVSIAVDKTGNPLLAITESYVVTDDGYTTVPEGQQQHEVKLTEVERIALQKAFLKYCQTAATREQVSLA